MDPGLREPATPSVPWQVPGCPGCPVPSAPLRAPARERGQLKQGGQQYRGVLLHPEPGTSGREESWGPWGRRAVSGGQEALPGHPSEGSSARGGLIECPILLRKHKNFLSLQKHHKQHLKANDKFYKVEKQALC